MIFRNLFRRKGRTILTLVGVAIGVAAIVALGAVARGMRAGFTAMTRGSQADLVLTQSETLSAMLSSVDETIADELRTWREVADLDAVLFGNTLTEDGSYLFFFGYDPEGFAIDHFLIVEGQKMSKSLGNYYRLQDVIDRGYDPLSFKFFVLSSHYRSRANFTWDALDAAEKGLKGLRQFYSKLDRDRFFPDQADLVKTTWQEFKDSMDDDLDTSGAIEALLAFAKWALGAPLSKAQSDLVTNKIESFLGVLGL